MSVIIFYGNYRNIIGTYKKCIIETWKILVVITIF